MRPFPDPDAWRRNAPRRPVSRKGRWSPRPGTQARSRRAPGRQGKHRWRTALFALIGLFAGLVTIGELAGDGDGQVSSPPTPTPVQPKGRPQEPGIGPSPVEPSKSAAQRPTVVGVIDGDTIDVRGVGGILPAGATSRVRLLTIDAPEKGACYSRDATARTKALLPKGSGVRIERDIKLNDPYGRYLLYVWNEQGVFVNDSLVRSGHAKGVLYPPNDAHWPKISQANETARKAGAGLWSACPGPAPKPAETPKPADADNPAGLPPGPPSGIPDVDCSDLSGAVWVGAADPHRLDRDGDGIGCDSK